MKKRNILTIALALVLTAVLSVGATLAYLTATDDQVVNTFTFANNMTVTLTEPQPTAVKNETIAGNGQNGYSYTNVVPGQLLNKAPTVSTITSVPAYVFVKISGATENVYPAAIKNGWEVVPGTTPDNNKNGVYYKAVNSGSADEQNLQAIFEQVQVGNVELENDQSGETPDVTTVDLDPITIEVYEIQQAGFADAAAALQETPFKVTPVTPAP